MSLAGIYKDMQKNLRAAYDAIEEKGGDLPDELNVENLAPAIESVRGQAAPWGTLYTTDYPNGLILDGEQSYKNLADGHNPNTVPNLTVNGKLIPKNSITGFVFGKNCTYTPIDFLTYCVNIDMLIKIPTTVQTINSPFMAACHNWTQGIEINHVPTFGGSSAGWTMGAEMTSAKNYQQGLPVYGTAAQTWLNQFPNASSRSPYRKLRKG